MADKIVSYQSKVDQSGPEPRPIRPLRWIAWTMLGLHLVAGIVLYGVIAKYRGGMGPDGMDPPDLFVATIADVACFIAFPIIWIVWGFLFLFRDIKNNLLGPNRCGEIEAIRQAYAALNRNDIPGFVSLLDPQIVRTEPADFPMAGTYRGIAAVTEHLTAGRGTWAEGSCEPQRFMVAGDRVVVLIDVHVRLKTEAEWRDGRIADVFTFRDGKAIEFRTFGDERQAMEWVKS